MSGMFGSDIYRNLLWIPRITLLVCTHGTITLYGGAFQPTCARQKGVDQGPNTTSLSPYDERFGLPSADFSRPYSPHLVRCLFLPVLGCFNSRGARSLSEQFRDHGINPCLRVPHAFRSLPRLSSAPKPSHSQIGYLTE